MARSSALVLIVLLSCARAAAPPPIPPAAIEVVAMPASAAPLPPPDPRARVIAQNVVTTFVLGETLYVAIEEPGPGVRVARVADDGTLAEVGSNLPSSQRTMSRGGQEVLSGTPSALLGDPNATVWLAWTHYSVFGSAEVYRTTPDGWRCVARCESPSGSHEAAMWERHLGTRTALGELTPTGDLVSNGSRGHLFRIQNRVSGEGGYYQLRERDVVALDETERARELGDGTIVLARSTAPRGTHLVFVARDGGKRERDVAIDLGPELDGTSAGDLWFEQQGTLARVRASDDGDEITRFELPGREIGGLFVASDGVAWLGGRTFVHAHDGHAWRKVRFATDPSFGAIALATSRVVYVRTEHELVRLDLM